MLNILVIGTGMYSTGRGTDAYGTVLPAISEWHRNNSNSRKVVFVGTNGSHSIASRRKAEQLARDTGVNLDISFLPEPDVFDLESYKLALKEIPRPACAIVVVPDHLHFQVAYDCLMEDLPILVVKPLTPTVKEAKKLVDLAEERSLHAAVEFHKRYDKANLMIRDTIQSDVLGDLLYCWVEYSQRKSIPTEVFKAWTEKTSVLQYLGVHYIDIVRFATNAKPKRVMALGQKNWLPSQGFDAYDAIQCFIEWRLPNGSLFTQTILTNWIDPESSSAMSDQKIKLVGTNGRFESDQKERGIKINLDNIGVEQPNPYFCYEFGNEAGRKEWRGYGIDSVKEFLSDIVNINSEIISRDTLQSERPTFAEALISTAVVEAAHESLANGNNWVNVKIEAE